MQPILIIACIVALVGCSAIPNKTRIAPVVHQHDSENHAPVVSKKKIVCPTNGHLYPCIVTSVKTPIASGPDFHGSPGPASITSGPTPGMTNPAPPESAIAAPHAHSVRDPHQEALALELRDLIATLRSLIADMADSRPHPLTGAWPDPSTSDHRPPAPMPSPAAASLVDPTPAAEAHMVSQAHNADDAPTTLAEPHRAPGGQADDPVRASSSPTTPTPGHAAPTRTLLASVYFPFNSVLLVPSEKIVLIDLLAQVRGKRLLFVGFTDRLGDKDTNTLVAYRRARAVKTFFLNTGLDPANLFAAAKGQCCYKTDGTTPTGRQHNRRVEIYETTETFHPRPLTSE